MEVVGVNVVDPGVGGGKYAGLWHVLQVRGPIHPDIQVGDVGPDVPHGPDPQGLYHRVAC